MSEELKIQNKHLLWLLMSFDAKRYLLSNTFGREDGFEKATCHTNLCETFIAGKMLCEADEIYDFDFDIAQKLFQGIHDHTQQLTGYLDTEIGLPLDTKHYDLDKLSRKFFEKFIKLAEEKWEEMTKEETED
tara:strand:- start:62516 stop:62911 length:396 start_codon:yes stop_codon:yes gene_type:complete